MLRTANNLFNQVRFMAFTIIVIVSGMSIRTAQAADASDYPTGVTYTATARVDESIGMRASASIRIVRLQYSNGY